MAIFPLVHTQLVPPRIENYIKRNGLRDIGRSILSHRITTIIAPAGYGKSTWIASLLEEPDWPPTAWLSLDRHDSDPSYLLYHLIHAIKRVLPEFGAQSLRTMNSLEDAGRDWLIAVSSMIEELPKEDEIVLVLDDYYLIEKNQAICDMMEYLIRWLPNKTHLVIISRNNLPIKLYREQLSDELLEIHGDQLLFSVDETQEFMSLLGLRIENKDIDVIHNHTEGWAVGLRLLGMYLKQSGGNLENNLFGLKQKDADLYTYLSNELLEHLPSELRDFLLDASLLPYLEPELCNAALKCNDSDIKIKELHSLGILSQVEGETITWRFHHLMGEFLEQKMSQLRPPDYVTSTRRRAASFLESKGDIDRALEQIATCADWPTMARIINDHGDKYFMQNGRLDSLKSWTYRLPEELANKDHWFLYFKGVSIIHTNLEEALDTLSRAADSAEEKGDIRCQVRSLKAMIVSYSFANNLVKIKETANRIPVAAALLKDPWSRGAVLVAGLSRAAWEDNLRQGVRLSWLTNKTKLDPESWMGYLIFSSVIQHRLGNLNSARELIEKALADPYVQANERWTGTVYSIYSIICLLLGEHEKLVEICNELIRMGQKYNIPHQLGIAYRRLALLHMGKGYLNEARNEFELSRSAFIQANNTYYAYLTDLDLILLRAKAGENTREMLPETKYALDKLSALPGGLGLDDYALSIAGIIAMEAGEFELAGQRFEEVSLRCKRKGSRQVLAGTQLFLARLSFLQGNDKAADGYLRKALGAAEAEGWEYFWDWHPETVYSLCQRALLKNIHPAWAAHLLRRWFPQRTCKEASNLLVHPNKGVQNCITGLMKDMVEKTGVTVIHINCLGAFRVFVNGIEIPPSEWKTKKVENLFKFLIINRGQQLKEKVIEALWPESDPKSGDASLRMALTHVRKALELDENSGESVILKRGMVYINPEIEIYTDYELFDAKTQSTLEDANIDNPVLGELLEQAADLYRGDFLPDNIYDDWATDLRTKLHQLYLQILSKKIEFYVRHSKLISAIQASRYYLTLEPTDEPVCRKAMELLWQNGQKQQALSLYHDLTSILAREYDMAPSVETNDLYEKIRCG